MTELPEFKIGQEARMILDLMIGRLASEDSLITLREIEDLTGRTVDSVRGSIYTARKHLRRDHKRWYVNDPGIGYRLMPDESLPECGKQNRNKARNLHRETIKILAVADSSRQSQQARTRTIMERSVAELGLATTAPRAVSRLEQIVARSHNELTSNQQMQAIKDALGQRQ